jgi:hypothetical protein
MVASSETRRWGLWDQLEREARERAESEATLLAQLAEDLGGRVAERSIPPLELEAPPPRSLLARRLEEAGRRQQEPGARPRSPRSNVARKSPR